MKLISLSLVILLIAGGVSYTPVSAATWHVEKDGSGDFTVIQDALEAAARDEVRSGGPAA